MWLLSLQIIGLFCVLVCAYLSQLLNEKFTSFAPVNEPLKTPVSRSKPHYINDIANSIPTLSQSKCSISCCPGEFSCSGGCICLTNEQKMLLGTRGYNSTQRESL